MLSPLATFRGALASAVIESQGLSSLSVEELARQIKVPESEHGDLALPCFILAKLLKDNPQAVAQKIAQALNSDTRFSRVEAVGPYVNVELDTTTFAETVLKAARREDFGNGLEGQNKTVVIDYSSPNIAKPLAFHHIRSTVIGQSLARLHQARGWTVFGINYLGDWGKQFGLLATGFERHGDPKRLNDAKHLVEVYVKTNKEANVPKRKAAIAAPETAQNFLAEVTKIKEALANTTDAKEKKKAEKNIRGLEKKLKELFGTDEDPIANFQNNLEELNKKKQEAKETLDTAEAYDQAARVYLKRMEDGEEQALASWKKFRDTSIEEFKKVYNRMGIHFDSIEGESFYKDSNESLELVRQKPGTKMDQGAELASVEPRKGAPPILLKTKDGTALYILRDVAAAMDRQKRFGFERSLYVVAADQSLHFEQLFTLLSAMGFEWAKNCHHVPFGRVHGMSTRRGNLVFLDEVLQTSAEKARSICEQSEKIDPAYFEEVVEAIGVGSIIFGDLKNLRTSDYNFSWSEVLDFRGHTAPYVQFSHARACSILRKASTSIHEPDYTLLKLPEERAVLKTLAAYPDIVLEACDSFEPSLVARHLLELAQVTSSWLTSGNKDRTKRVLVEGDKELQNSRLALVDAIRSTLKHGLHLLGVQAPESM